MFRWYNTVPFKNTLDVYNKVAPCSMMIQIWKENYVFGKHNVSTGVTLGHNVKVKIPSLSMSKSSDSAWSKKYAY